MMTPRDREYAQHITDLAHAFGVVLQVRPNLPPDQARAGLLRTGKGVVLIAPVTDETTYAVALHELGHCIAPLGRLTQEYSMPMRMFHIPTTLRDVRLQLEAEHAAWDWAQATALEWTPAMTYVKAMTLGSYERVARRYGVHP